MAGWIEKVLLSRGVARRSTRAYGRPHTSGEVVMGAIQESERRRWSRSAYGIIVVVALGCAPLDDDPGRKRVEILHGEDDINVTSDTDAHLSNRRRAATVRFDWDGTDRIRCSGTLISPRVVLTNYHCVESGAPAEVKLGWGAGHIAKVIGCLVFPDTDGSGPATCGDGGSASWKFDLAALVLDERYEWGPKERRTPRTNNFPVVPAELVTSDPLVDGSRHPNHWAGTMARVVGWGKTETGELPVIRQSAQREITGTNNGWPWPWDYLNDTLKIEDYSRRGDSGGSVMLGDPDVGDLRLLAVTVGYNPAEVPTASSLAARVTEPSVRSWLGSLLGSSVTFGAADVWLGHLDLPPRDEPDRRLADRSLRAADPDGDGLVHAHDNCDALYNPEQRDDDEDGVGDVPNLVCQSPGGIEYVFTCTDEIDDDDGDGIPNECDPCPYIPAELHDDADWDGDGVPDACDACPGLDDTSVNPTVDTDGDGIPDGCDNCILVPNDDQRNCNLEVEVLQGLRAQGDVCDPTACPDVEPEYGIEPPEGVPPENTTIHGPYRFSNANLHGFGVVEPSGARVEGTARTGFRWCPCESAADNSVGMRFDCAQPPHSCVIDHDEYDGGFDLSEWRFMSLGMRLPPVTGLEREEGIDTEYIMDYRSPDEHRYMIDGTPPRLGSWDFVTDASAAGVLYEPSAWAFPPPWIPENPPGPSPPPNMQAVNAVVWSHMIGYEVAEEAEPWGCNASSANCAAPDPSLTSHYSSGQTWKWSFHRDTAMPMIDPGVRQVMPCILPPSIWPHCLHFPVPHLGIGEDEPSMRMADAALPVFDLPFQGDLDPLLLEVWREHDELIWLAAAEPLRSLRGSAIRMAGYDPQTGEVRLFARASSSGIRAMAGPLEALEPGIEGATVILSGNTGQIIVVGAVDEGEPTPMIQRLDLVRSERRDLELATPLGTALSAAIDASGRWMLVLDEDPEGDARRLSRVDLATGQVTVLARGDNPETDRHALVALPGDAWALLVSASESGNYSVAVFSIEQHQVEVRSSASGDGMLMRAQAHGGEQGVSFVLMDDTAGWRPAGVRYSEMGDGVAITELF